MQQTQGGAGDGSSPGIAANGKAMITYKSLCVFRHGGPEVLEVVENELRPPAAGEVRIRVLAASVGRPDVTARQGKALYTGTPLEQKLPFTPGYAVIGEAEAAGDGVDQAVVGKRVGALTVIGGYTEYIYWRSDRLIPIPDGLDLAEAVTILLNYIVAYQALHRSAKARAGEKALIVGASGGIGTALLQLGQLAGLQMYAIASRSKQAIAAAYGATPIDYHTQDFAEVIRQHEPDGIDVVLDGMMQLNYIHGSLPLLRRGGRIVSFGEPASRGELFRILATAVGTNLLPNGKSLKLYGTSTYFLFDRRPYLEDWAVLFRLLGERKIAPVIAARFPILEAARANALLESGQVIGNVVLLTPALLTEGNT
ncbi:MAG: zinc-binding dehydrogenase [Chloroflexota bacterium]